MISLALLALVGSSVPLEELFAKVDPSVVTVRVGTKSITENGTGAVVIVSVGTGSGVLVHPDGYVVTAAHVVEAAEHIEVHWLDGFKTTAKVVSLSRTEDIALLKVEATPAKAVVARWVTRACSSPGSGSSPSAPPTASSTPSPPAW